MEPWVSFLTLRNKQIHTDINKNARELKGPGGSREVHAYYPLTSSKSLSRSWGQHRKEKGPRRQGSRLTVEAENREVSSQYHAIAGFWDSWSKLLKKEEHSPRSEGLKSSVGLQGRFSFIAALIVRPRQSLSVWVSSSQQTQAIQLYFLSRFLLSMPSCTFSGSHIESIH